MGAFTEIRKFFFVSPCRLQIETIFCGATLTFDACAQFILRGGLSRAYPEAPVFFRRRA
jgi:hypothetical protein